MVVKQRVTLFLIFFLSFGSYLKAQINTDRPTQTSSSFLVSKGALQIETGYANRKFNNENFFTLNSTQIRYGVSRKIELRVSQDLSQNRIDRGTNGTFTTDPNFTNAQIGVRVHLLDEDKWVPQMSVQANIGVDLSDVRLNMSHNINRDWCIGYTLGLDFPNAFSYRAIYSVVANYAMRDKFTLFTELSGNSPRFHTKELSLTFGLLFAAGPNLQLDIYSGRTITAVKTYDSVLGFGLAFSLPKK